METNSTNRFIASIMDQLAGCISTIRVTTSRPMVGAALGRGVLTEEEATPEILEALKSCIEFARNRWGEDDDESDGTPSDNDSGD